MNIYYSYARQSNLNVLGSQIVNAESSIYRHFYVLMTSHMINISFVYTYLRRSDRNWINVEKITLMHVCGSRRSNLKPLSFHKLSSKQAKKKLYIHFKYYETSSNLIIIKKPLQHMENNLCNEIKIKVRQTSHVG